MIPKITFKPLTQEETARVLSWSLFETSGPLPLRDKTLQIYSNLNMITKNQNQQLIIDEIMKIINSQYEKDEHLTNKLTKKYQQIWDKYNDEYMQAISQILEIEWPENARNITGKVGNLPVCPRYIQERLFYINYTTEEEIIDTCMHECCHFLFFEKCKQVLKNITNKDFDTPALLWYLSEILIDPILNSNKIQKIFKHKFKSYDIFYNVNINNQPLMKTMNEILNNNTITDAIIKSYDYLIKYEQELKTNCE